MRKSKEQPTVEQHLNDFKNFPLPDQIEIYKAIKQHLEYTQKQAQQVQDQLAQVVKEKN